MFVPAPDATVAADGTTITTTGKAPWLLQCVTCEAIAGQGNFDEETQSEPGDGLRYDVPDLDALDNGI